MSDEGNPYRYLRMTIDVVVLRESVGKRLFEEENSIDLEQAIKDGDIEVDGISDMEVH